VTPDDGGRKSDKSGVFAVEPAPEDAEAEPLFPDARLPVPVETEPAPEETEAEPVPDKTPAEGGFTAESLFELPAFPPFDCLASCSTK